MLIFMTQISQVVERDVVNLQSCLDFGIIGRNLKSRSVNEPDCCEQN